MTLTLLVPAMATCRCTMRYGPITMPAAKMLIANGADLSIKGLDGNTPLANAQAEGKEEIAAYPKQVKVHTK